VVKFGCGSSALGQDYLKKAFNRFAQNSFALNLKLQSFCLKGLKLLPNIMIPAPATGCGNPSTNIDEPNCFPWAALVLKKFPQRID
jgi:hypothetical protein